jgi:hypothetical protein
MTKTLSPKLAQKQVRNQEILKEFVERSKKGDMTMGIADDICTRYKSMGAKISVATILRIVRVSGYFENKNENKFAS